MSEQELEFATVEIVAYAGDARSKYIEAMGLANDGKIGEAETLVTEANELIDEAHKVQTSMIQMEAAGDHVKVSFLMVHAQDHLMTAMLLRDMVRNYINLAKKVNK